MPAYRIQHTEVKESTVKELERALKDSTLSKRECLRIHSVLLRKKGYARKEIAVINNVSVSFIEDWLTAYHKRGILGLRSKKREIPPKYVLLRLQKEQIAKILREKEKPSDAGIVAAKDEDYWSLPTLRKLVKKLFNVEYESNESYRKLFVSAGYSYQRVEFVDNRRKEQDGKDFKKRLKVKLKKGGMSMWW